MLAQSHRHGPQPLGTRSLLHNILHQALRTQNLYGTGSLQAKKVSEDTCVYLSMLALGIPAPECDLCSEA